MMGIEVFDSSGHIVPIDDPVKQVPVFVLLPFQCRPPPFAAPPLAPSHPPCPCLCVTLGAQVYTDAPDIADGLEDGEASDPRTVDNLVDGHNYTTDDLHAWLAGFQVRLGWNRWSWEGVGWWQSLGRWG
jgi:hypothetical protein